MRRTASVSGATIFVSAGQLPGSSEIEINSSRQLNDGFVGPAGPDYKDLGKLKHSYPGVPFMALTATANNRVKEDIASQLNMRGCLMLTASFNRKNLYYEIRPKTKKVLAEMAAFIKKDHAGETGIVYCLSQRMCEQTADELRNKFGIKAHHYHAGSVKSGITKGRMVTTLTTLDHMLVQDGQKRSPARTTSVAERHVRRDMCDHRVSSGAICISARIRLACPDVRNRHSLGSAWVRSGPVCSSQYGHWLTDLSPSFL